MVMEVPLELLVLHYFSIWNLRLICALYMHYIQQCQRSDAIIQENTKTHIINSSHDTVVTFDPF